MMKYTPETDKIIAWILILVILAGLLVYLL